jgi:hypothetical protein
MALTHHHRPASPGYVKLQASVPPALLTAETFAPLLALHSAYLAAQADVEAAHDALAEAKDAKVVRDATIRQAVMNGKKPPAGMSDTEAKTLAEVATANLNAALRSAYNAAKAYEDALVQHRTAIRHALVPAFREADETAREARRLADLADADRASLLASLNALDDAAAEAARAESGEQTHRFANAVSQARTRLGETAAVEADLLPVRGVPPGAQRRGRRLPGSRTHRRTRGHPKRRTEVPVLRRPR